MPDKNWMCQAVVHTYVNELPVSLQSLISLNITSTEN